MKNAIKILLFVFLFIGCKQQNKEDLGISNHETLVKKYFDYFNHHDWKNMAAMYADTADFKDPSLGAGIVKQTRQQTIQKYSALNTIFPNLHDEIIQTYPSDSNHIIIEFISTGTAPDSTTFTLPICTILTIQNGLITKDYTYFDNFEEQK